MPSFTCHSFQYVEVGSSKPVELTEKRTTNCFKLMLLLCC